jgi:hypothetical protein
VHELQKMVENFVICYRELTKVASGLFNGGFGRGSEGHSFLTASVLTTKMSEPMHVSSTTSLLTPNHFRGKKS